MKYLAFCFLFFFSASVSAQVKLLSHTQYHPSVIHENLTKSKVVGATAEGYFTYGMQMKGFYDWETNVYFFDKNHELQFVQPIAKKQEGSVVQDIDFITTTAGIFAVGTLTEKKEGSRFLISKKLDFINEYPFVRHASYPFNYSGASSIAESRKAGFAVRNVDTQWKVSPDSSIVVRFAGIETENKMPFEVIYRAHVFDAEMNLLYTREWGPLSEEEEYVVRDMAPDNQGNVWITGRPKKGLYGKYGSTQHKVFKINQAAMIEVDISTLATLYVGQLNVAVGKSEICLTGVYFNAEQKNKMPQGVFVLPISEGSNGKLTKKDFTEEQRAVFEPITNFQLDVSVSVNKNVPNQFYLRNVVTDSDNRLRVCLLTTLKHTVRERTKADLVTHYTSNSTYGENNPVYIFNDLIFFNYADGEIADVSTIEYNHTGVYSTNGIMKMSDDNLELLIVQTDKNRSNKKPRSEYVSALRYLKLNQNNKIVKDEYLTNADLGLTDETVTGIRRNAFAMYGDYIYTSNRLVFAKGLFTTHEKLKERHFHTFQLKR